MKRLFLTQTAAIVAMALWVCGGCVTDPVDGDVGLEAHVPSYEPGDDKEATT